jgi:carboxyl-terminal processing protease
MHSRLPALPFFASLLVSLLVLSCRGPHVHGPGCEYALIATPAQTSASPAVAAEPAPQAPPAAELTAAAALAAFDEAWQTIHDTHFDPRFNGVDWDALKAELRPRAERSTTHAELRAVIADMLARLGQSHFAVIPSDALPEAGAASHDLSGGLGFDVRLRAGRLLVVRVDAKGAAAAAGVASGWSVQRIGAFDVPATLSRMGAAEEQLGARRLAFTLWQVAQGHLLGPVGETRACAFLDAEERPVELELTRRARDVQAFEVGPTLPTFYLEFQSGELERGGARIGYLAFSNWFVPLMQPLDAAVERMRAFDGIVLDLRGNTGGAAAMTMGVAGHFFRESKKLGVMLTRDSQLNILAFPRRVNAAGELVEPFAGPLAILVDETTGSASEVFAGGMQALGRASVFGETSAGAVLPAVTTRLPNGDTLLHALGDFETSTGQRLEGTGVVPDVSAPLERAGLLAGRDAPLEAALDWIASTKKQ